MERVMRPQLQTRPIGVNQRERTFNSALGPDRREQGSAPARLHILGNATSRESPRGTGRAENSPICGGEEIVPTRNAALALRSSAVTRTSPPDRVTCQHGSVCPTRVAFAEARSPHCRAILDPRTLDSVDRLNRTWQLVSNTRQLPAERREQTVVTFRHGNCYAFP